MLIPGNLKLTNTGRLRALHHQETEHRTKQHNPIRLKQGAQSQILQGASPAAEITTQKCQEYELCSSAQKG